MNRESQDNFAQPQQNQAASGSSGPSVSLIAFLVVTALAAVFFLQNSERTIIDFWVFEKETTIRWSLLMAIVFGIAIDRLFTFWWRRRRKKKQNEAD